MLTGKVLTAAFLLNVKEPTKSSVEMLRIALERMNMFEWESLKDYIKRGTFLYSSEASKT